MRIVTLVENTAARTGLEPARGLSIYVETAGHKILFDMGPGPELLANAERLGVDLAAVDTAVLSHGHSDHGGGLEAFCRVNRHAGIYLREEALRPYYAVLPGQDPHYIGLDPLWEQVRDRLVFTEPVRRLDEELLLFSGVEDDRTRRAPAPKLQEKTPGGFRPDGFAHEQHLIIRSEGKMVLLAGCGHLGIVNTLERAGELLGGRMPDAVFGGFHLFELSPEAESARALLDLTAGALSRGQTVYYTGHCTGEWAYEELRKTLGGRLRPMRTGTAVEL